MERTLTLTGNRSLSVTCIEEVVSFDEKGIVLSGGDENILIKGSGLKVLSFDGEKKLFEASGEVFSITYKKNLHVVKKLFK